MFNEDLQALVNDTFSCKLCESDELEVFLSLGPMPPANEFLEREEVYSSEDFYPLDVYFCKSCNHVGVLPRISSEELFDDYVYLTSNSETMLSHLEDLTDKVCEKIIEDQENSFVVDIGSNDGSLLEFFQDRGSDVLGIEPASNIALKAEEKDVRTLNEYFDRETARKVVDEEGYPDVVMATNVFAHVPDLDEFVEGVKVLLEGGGKFVFENAYLPDLVKNKEFDTIYHEHHYYHSLTPLKPFFESFGLKITDAERISIHGGSIRVTVSAEDEEPSDRVQELLSFERKQGFDSIEKYREFARDVKEIKRDLNELIQELNSQGEKVVGYGAAAKGNTLLNFCDIGNDEISYISDNIPIKQGKYTPGTRIPVKSPEEFREDRPDYALLLAWNYAEEIIRKEEEFLRNGGKFIVPIPEVRVIEEEYLG